VTGNVDGNDTVSILVRRGGSCVLYRVLLLVCLFSPC